MWAWPVRHSKKVLHGEMRLCCDVVAGPDELHRRADVDGTRARAGADDNVLGGLDTAKRPTF